MLSISTVPTSSLPTFENVMISAGVIFNIAPKLYQKTRVKFEVV